MKLDKLFQSLLLTSAIAFFLGAAAKGEGVPQANKNISQLSEIKLPATNAQMLVQQPAPTNPPVTPLMKAGEVIAITGVKANPTEQGVEVILETTQGEQLQVTNRSTGNNFIADIPGAQLRLPTGEAFTFKSEKPITGITQITVTNIDANTVRVTVVGEKALPTVELFDDNAGLVFGVASQATAQNPTPPAAPLPLPRGGEGEGSEQPVAQEDEPIELLVTGEQDGYRVPNTSVGTRTDTPLRDIPASIQVIPQQVLEEQQVDSLNEALKNVPGVIQNTPNDTPIFNSFTIRGFFAGEGQNFTRNGLNLPYADSTTTIFSNIERVEVLRGPASVLFGGGNPGGTINIVTKQPLRDPFYSVEASAGSYNFYQGAIDLTGPLNDSKTILYRLNASYESAESFVDFVEREIPAIAGALKFEIGENTELTFDVQYVAATQGGGSGLPLEGTILPNPNGQIPRNRNLSGADGRFILNTIIVGYNLEHRFSENWSLQNAFYFSDYDYAIRDAIFPSSLEPDLRTAQRLSDEVDVEAQSFDLSTNIVGKFSTGAIQHQLLIGADLRRFDSNFSTSGVFRAAPIDLFNPVYSTEIFEQTDPPSASNDLTNSLGIYVQDQVAITKNLKLLLGGRFDTFERTDQDLINDSETFQSGNAFSPRLGIVYQPIEPISLYASYSRSFIPTIGRSFDGEPFKPGRGTQYEIGVKADINDKLSTTLALYDLTRTNVNTVDPNNPNFEIQTGEQNSQGIELNIAGEILPGWNVIAGYAYTDARITKDNTFPVGNRINNVPRNSFNLWTSYEFQKGTLRGLGFGLGFFYVGDRQGDLDNTFTLPSYFRTDAAIFYKRDRFRASLNVNNLFDVEYFENSNGALAIYPADPLTVQGTLSWEF
ncbi:TonB-dependent receptor [Chlorogloeopsis sp. ULAP01]|uniref:TonB-dependent receptor n=1 Tax=Chlorogloeopsis sp. ULAP01 TaxID=3056483 RepID=UPI0025AB29F8|nr:TonB-dependent receptor [Chlorogloeopsis sp. ULAP01]MDM9379785.1 TonB-dependent receptor [Chlorogloeopsis sp. ULAP01]